MSVRSPLEKDAALYFRDALKAARENVLKDAEAFLDIIHVVERLGSVLPTATGERGTGLGKFAGRIRSLVGVTPLSGLGRPWHSEFDGLYNSIRVARNDAVHQGAFARHLASNSVRLSIIVEDALMGLAEGGDAGSATIEAYMVRNPVCASMWQPISFIRQAMLENSFSYLPAWDKAQGRWLLVSDHAIATYLNVMSRGERLLTTLEVATRTRQDSTSPPLGLIEAKTCSPVTTKRMVLDECEGRPVLVVQDGLPSELIGIVTPFDLL